MVSEKPDVILALVPLFFFKLLNLSLIFCSLKMIYLYVGLFFVLFVCLTFILFGVL